jgi:hypothetical protein
MPMSTKCQKMRKKLQLMPFNMMICISIGYDAYDRFTMEQNLLLATVHKILKKVSKSKVQVKCPKSSPKYSCGQIKLGSNFFYCKSELNIKSPEKSSPKR